MHIHDGIVLDPSVVTHHRVTPNRTAHSVILELRQAVEKWKLCPDDMGPFVCEVDRASVEAILRAIDHSDSPHSIYYKDDSIEPSKNDKQVVKIDEQSAMNRMHVIFIPKGSKTTLLIEGDFVGPNG